MSTPTETDEHLKLISIFHYVVGGVTALSGCAGSFHFLFGVMALINPGLFGSSPSESIPPVVGVFFALFGGLWIVLCVTIGILIIISGRRIARRERHTFSLVMAAIMCLCFPFGTVLGVFTIILLTKAEVRALYGEVPQGVP